MPQDWNDDDQLLAALGEAARATPEVPAPFVDIGRSAFTWRTVDAELAELAHDSATGELVAVRARPDNLRSLTFVAPRLTIELEVQPDALLGQLVPPQRGEVELHRREGATSTVLVDDVGWFAIQPLPSGPIRLQIRPAGGIAVMTEWVLF